MAHPRRPDEGANREAKRHRADADTVDEADASDSADALDSADTEKGFDVPDVPDVPDGDDERYADVADPDRDVDPGGVDLDTEEADDISVAAERLARRGDLDEELSEELGVDNIVGPLEAGLGGGLDQAEEARAGITDEEIAKKTRRR